MIKKSKKILLLSCMLLALINPAHAGYWDYYGSGRDHPYSSYISQGYNSGHITFSPYTADFIDAPYLAPYPPSPYTAPVPTVITTPQSNEFTVNIPNRNGGYTAVVIKKVGDEYIGPKGEHYPEFPKVFQLELTYGS